MLGMENMDTKWLKDVPPYVSDSRLSPAFKLNSMTPGLTPHDPKQMAAKQFREQEGP